MRHGCCWGTGLRPWKLLIFAQLRMASHGFTWLRMALGFSVFFKILFLYILSIFPLCSALTESREFHVAVQTSLRGDIFGQRPSTQQRHGQDLALRLSKIVIEDYTGSGRTFCGSVGVCDSVHISNWYHLRNFADFCSELHGYCHVGATSGRRSWQSLCLEEGQLRNECLDVLWGRERQSLSCFRSPTRTDFCVLILAILRPTL